MKDRVDAVYQLGEEILKGKYTKAELEQKMDWIEEKFGKASFPPFTVIPKPKPWDAAYLSELKMQRYAGAGSRAFFLHLQEVKEEVDRKAYKVKKRLIIVSCIAGVLLLAAVVTVLLAFLRE